MFFRIPDGFHFAARMLQFYRASGLSPFLRTTGLLERFLPDYARAEALTPEVEFTQGVRPGNVYPALGRREGTVAFLSGCVMNSLLGDVNRSTVDLLTGAGLRRCGSCRSGLLRGVGQPRGFQRNRF